jgi:hypothetical protein
MGVKSQLKLIIALSNGCNKFKILEGHLSSLVEVLKARRIYLSNISAVLNAALVTSLTEGCASNIAVSISYLVIQYLHSVLANFRIPY